MATPQKMAELSRKKSRTSRKGSRPAKTIEVPFRPAPDFRYLPSTGALVRASPEGAVITFYVDDTLPVSQSGDLSDYGEGYATYKAGKLTEETCRWLQVGVRVSLHEAAALAKLLVQKIRQANPSVAEELGLMQSEKVNKE